MTEFFLWPETSSSGTHEGLITMLPGSIWLLNQLAPSGTWLMPYPVAWQSDFTFSCCHSWQLNSLLSLPSEEMTPNNMVRVISMHYYLSVAFVAKLRLRPFLTVGFWALWPQQEQNAEVQNVLDCDSEWVYSPFSEGIIWAPKWKCFRVV